MSIAQFLLKMKPELESMFPISFSSTNLQSYLMIEHTVLGSTNPQSYLMIEHTVLGSTNHQSYLMIEHTV